MGVVTMEPMLRHLGVAAFISVLCVPAVAALEGGEDGEAREIIRCSAIRAGLCLHLGCGRDSAPALTAALAENSGLLVHALALDDAALARARKAIKARGMVGRAMAESIECPPLPYLNDLANLAVVEDMTALAAQGVTREEVLRVLAPGGVLCAKEGGKWTQFIKPRSPEMDEWTHPYHGADGNLVSSDKVLQLPIGLRWVGGLAVNVTGVAAVRAWVLAGGRCFTLGLNELENLDGLRGNFKKELYLSACDAFNGIPLWKLDCETEASGWDIFYNNEGPLVAAGSRVFTVKKDKVVALDAATGQIEKAWTTKYPAYRLLVADGVLLAACWEEKGAPQWQPWMPKVASGSVEAFAARSGAARWSLPVAAFKVLAAGGVAYCLVQSGIPPAEQQIIALQLQTGIELWRVPHSRITAQPNLDLTFAGPDYLVVASCKEKSSENATVVLSAADGSERWRRKGASNWTPLVDGLLWLDRRCDPETGEVKGDHPFWFYLSHGCSANKVTPRYIIEGNNIADRAGLPPKGTGRHPVLAVKPACVEGFVPANGMLYNPAKNCKCFAGSLHGSVALGPSGEWPSATDFEKPWPVEKGPAFGKLDEVPAASDDWPTYRHDPQRSGATAAQAPVMLKEIWRLQVAKPANGSLASAWQARLGSCLSAPVVAGGRVFVAGTDEGRIVALSAATGSKLWTVLLGSRVDTPPTIHKGLCLIGCHDGWVYALQAKDGELAWRSRVAPWERRLVAYGQVESVWPAVGSVLLNDNVAYATAGRTTESDGGIAVVALDPATGAAIWRKAIAPGAARTGDILVMREGSVAWRYLNFDPKTGAPVGPTAVPSSKVVGNEKGRPEGSMIDASWTVMESRLAGFAYSADGKDAHLMVWDDSHKVPAPAVATPRGQQVEAMALAGDLLVAAGRVKKANSSPTGFLWLLSTADNRKLVEVALDAPVTLDGLAIAAGQVFVSLQNGMLVCFGSAPGPVP